MDYIIIQAGGKGTRLGYLTKNKPKALAPIENLPMIFYLFRKYPDRRFVIIADYKKDVLRKYLAAFADVKYRVIDAVGTGTCSGVAQAAELIPDGEPFMLVWSDLILPKDLVLPDEQERDYIGISGTFPCRWKYEDGEFTEESSVSHGVAGFFLFHDKSVIADVPESGELVRWMQQKKMRFDTVDLSGTREFGLLSEYEKLEQQKTRPFNRIIVDGDTLTKEPVDEQGKNLAKRECAWYAKACELGITDIPKIFDTDPLRMEFIRGHNIYECDLPYENRKEILSKLVDSLKRLHASEHVPADSLSIKEAYFNKTINRLSKIEDLVPFGREKSIRINGRDCRNVFYHKARLESLIGGLSCDHFSFIHGDCTFSNLMIRDDGRPVLIDPRGYFGFTELYGDERYDWAKLYYSIVGNYDKFNLKKFDLTIRDHSTVDGETVTDIDGNDVILKIKSNGWEDLEDAFFEMTGADRFEIKLLHAVIWLSLTTYAWQDYDSVCGAFYNGLYYLEEVL